MTAVSLSFGVASYVAAAVAYLAVLVLVLPSQPGTRAAVGFVAAVAVSAAWALALAVALFALGDFRAWMVAADAVRTAVWTGFIAMLLRSRTGVPAAARLGNLLAVAAGVLAAIVLLAALTRRHDTVIVVGQALPLALLALPLVGLLGLEQLFRNAVFDQRGVLVPLCVGIGLIFAIDVFVFSQSLLFLEVNRTLWLLRGAADAAAAPLLLLAVKRQPDWGRGVFVSRHVVFYTTTLVAAGLYLLAMAVGGFLIAASGASWGPVLQGLFLVAAGGVLFYTLFSVSVRRRFKVFIAKHFYRNRYDYREEWLRLIHTLAGPSDAALPERSVQALAAIIGSPRGDLWLADPEGRAYEPYGAWRSEAKAEVLSRDEPLVMFLDATRWVVDTQEYAKDAEKYSNAFAADTRRISSPAIYVPLVREGSLAGIVRLERPVGLGALSYEDHDLLKTAGQQVAIFLEQERAQEQLSETRQFEAFSRFTAFLMHDLKNLIAQQELVVGNAQRFKHRPEFIDDAIRTIEASVQRMKNVLERLQSASRHDQTSLVRVDNVLRDVCAACSDREPKPILAIAPQDVRVAMDRHRLAMALTHAIRNAQDATPADGRIELRLSREAGKVRIDVQDTGSGMDPDFVRNRLFKPFHSTKGAKGMGIGAYQIRETLRSAGGDVEVYSDVGMGTTLRMSLPASELAESAA